MTDELPARRTPEVLKLIDEVPDPRTDRCKRHPLNSIIFVALVTTLSGADNWVEVTEMGQALESWFTRYIELPNGIPSHDTFGRVFGLIEPAAFNKLLISWADNVRQRVDKEVVAFDGKTLRGSKSSKDALAGLHVLNAWSVDNGVALGQLAVDAKTNEIKVTPELIKLLDLEGCVVTADAINTQKAIANEIVEAGADYILPVKENHKTLLEEVELLFQEAEEKGYRGIDADNQVTTDMDHGRFETREYFVLDAEGLPSQPEWRGLKSVGKVVRTRTIESKTSTEEAYFIISFEIDAALFARGTRGHWGVETAYTGR